MNIFGKTTLLQVCILLFAIGAQAGDEVGIEDIINSFNRRHPQERVFLHFDNTAYYENEIIWFKAYMLRTDNDRLGSVSSVLYVLMMCCFVNTQDVVSIFSQGRKYVHTVLRTS